MKAARGLDKVLFAKLAAGAFIGQKQNLLIIGKTGLGKSWLACALGHKACRDDRHWTRVTDQSDPPPTSCVNDFTTQTSTNVVPPLPDIVQGLAPGCDRSSAHVSSLVQATLVRRTIRSHSIGGLWPKTTRGRRLIADCSRH